MTMSIKRVQNREREKDVPFTKTGPDMGSHVTTTAHGHANGHQRKSSHNGSFREWESLNVGKVRPDFVSGPRDAKV